MTHLEIIKTEVDSDLFETIWVGKNVTADISYDLQLDFRSSVDDSMIRIKELMQEKGIIFKVW